MSGYYRVTCKCGHTGSRNTYIPITFAVVAEDSKEAAKIARFIPRCKHHHKDCILSVIECSYEEFLIQKEINNNNPYLKCKSIQEQRLLNIEHLFVPETRTCNKVVYKREKQDGKKCFLGKKELKNPKKYLNNYHQQEYELMEAVYIC